MEVGLEGKRIGDLLRTGEAAGRLCFVGATPPPIYSKTGQHLLEGYAARDCDSYASFEDRLIEGEINRPPKSENSQYVQRIEFDSLGRIELTTACRLILGDAPPPATVAKLRNRVGEGQVERFLVSNSLLQAITVDQASAGHVLDYYRAHAFKGGPIEVHRIRKKLIGTQKWFYGPDGKLIETTFESAPAE